MTNELCASKFVCEGAVCEKVVFERVTRVKDVCVCVKDFCVCVCV